MLLIKGDRYEYEMNMLLLIRSWGIPYREIPITTIYYNNNAGIPFSSVPGLFSGNFSDPEICVFVTDLVSSRLCTFHDFRALF